MPAELTATSSKNQEPAVPSKILPSEKRNQLLGLSLKHGQLTLPLAVEAEEILPASLWNLKSLRLGLDLGSGEITGLSTSFASQVSTSISFTLLDVPSDIESVSGCLWNTC